MVEEQERFIAMRDFFMGFADTTMTPRQAEAIAKHYIRYNPDPLKEQYEKDIAQGRQEFAAQQRIIQKKNSDISDMSRAYKAALLQVDNLKRQLVRKK